MTLLATNDRAWVEEPVPDFVPGIETDYVSNGFGNKKKDGPSHESKQSPTEQNKLASSPATKTPNPRHENQLLGTTTSCDVPLQRKHKHSRTMSTVPTEMSSTVQSEIGVVPMEISWNASLPPNQQEHVKSTSKIPKEISFHLSSSSSVSVSVQSDIESEAHPQIRRAPKNIQEYERQLDFHNKCICLELLESERFDDNCVGMEHFVSMANNELVNSSRFMVSESCDNKGSMNKNNGGSLLSSSIAYSLVCNTTNNWQFSKRLRAVFPTFLWEHRHKTSYRSRTLRCNNGIENENSDTDSTTSLSSSSSLSSSCSSCTDTSSRMIVHRDGDSKASLKLPALRILLSSLELLSRTRTLSHRPSSSSVPSAHHPIDLLDSFWRLVLAYMTECLRDLVRAVPIKGAVEELPTTADLNRSKTTHHYNDKDATAGTPPSCSIEAALVMKGFRLLHKLQPEIMSPYVRYSLLPFVSNAREFGFEQQQLQLQQRKHQRRPSGDKMLVRECERLLRWFL